MVGYFLKSERLQKKNKKQLITFAISSSEKKKENKITVKKEKKNLDVPARSWILDSGLEAPRSNHFATLTYVSDCG